MIIQSAMASHLKASVFASPTRRPASSASKVWSRHNWLAVCTARLGQLRPDERLIAVESMARAMWLDVGTFDPVIAAEMEYQTWLAGDPAAELDGEVASL